MLKIDGVEIERIVSGIKLPWALKRTKGTAKTRPYSQKVGIIPIEGRLWLVPWHTKN
jgi:hypothetical protein